MKEEPENKITIPTKQLSYIEKIRLKELEQEEVEARFTQQVPSLYQSK